MSGAGLFQPPASTLRLLTGCLVLLYGCSAEYKAERLYWHAERAAAAVSKDPAKASAADVSAALAGLNNVIQKAPGTLPAARAQFAIGSLHMLRKEYAQSRSAYEQVLRNHSQQGNLVFGARLALAKTYADENDAEGAIAAYRQIIEHHPWSAVGLSAPLAIAQNMQQRGQQQAATAAYQSAADHYVKLLDKAPNPVLAARAKGQLIVALQRLQLWEEALKWLAQLAEADAGAGINRPMVLLVMANVYDVKLQQMDAARALYAQLIREYPDHTAAAAAARRLKQLENP